MGMEWLRRRNIFKYEENEKKTKQYELREEELHLIHVFFVLYEMQLCCNFNDLCCIHMDVYVCIRYVLNTYALCIHNPHEYLYAVDSTSESVGERIIGFLYIRNAMQQICDVVE